MSEALASVSWDVHEKRLEFLLAGKAFLLAGEHCKMYDEKSRMLSSKRRHKMKNPAAISGSPETYKRMISERYKKSP